MRNLVHSHQTLKPIRLGVMLYCMFCSVNAIAVTQTQRFEPNIPRPQLPSLIPSQPATPALPLSPEADEINTNSDTKVSVQSFNFTGNQHISSEVLAGLLKPYLNQALSFKQLNEAAKQVRNYYREQGYLLAQVYFPKQNIQNQHLEIAVLEGQLGEIRVTSANAASTEAAVSPLLGRMATYQLEANKVIREQNLVRNVNTLNALPGIDATAQLNPGAQVGSSDVSITLTSEQTWHAYFAFNTYGNRFTGRETFLAGLAFNNPLNLGDQLSLGVRTTQNQGLNSLNLNYITPVHASGTLLNLALSTTEYRLGRELSPLKASGKAHYASAYIDQPLYRDGHKSLGLRLGGQHKYLDDEVSLFALNNERAISHLELGLLGDWTNASGKVNYQSQLSFSMGHLSFEDNAAEASDQQTINTKGDFYKWNLGLVRSQLFEHGFSWQMRADLQWANQNLDSAEKMSIGASNRWRAYAELPGQADQGWVVSNELRRPWFLNAFFQNKSLNVLSPYVFYDFGKGRINKDALSQDNHLTTIHWGLGLDMAFKNQWLFDLSFSEQKRVLQGSAGESEQQLWGQLKKAF